MRDGYIEKGKKLIEETVLDFLSQDFEEDIYAEFWSASGEKFIQELYSDLKNVVKQKIKKII